MLRTNSKVLKERVRQHIVESYNDWQIDNGEKITTDFKKISREILKTCFRDKSSYNVKTPEQYYEYIVNRFYKHSFQELFTDWTQGLPSIIDCNYWLYSGKNNPINILGDWLEQTEEERVKFDFEESAKMITYLIYSELLKAINDDIFSIIKEVLR